MNEQEFPQGSVPVAVAARVYGKDASWVRAGIVSGWLPIGKATRSGKLVTTIEEMDSRYPAIYYHTLAFIAIHDLTSIQILPTKR